MSDSAIRILAEAKERMKPDVAGRIEAADALIAALLKAAQEAGYEAGRESGAYVISLSGKGAVVFGNHDGQLLIARHGTQNWLKPELDYDPIDRSFVGKDVDDSVAPVPGTRVKRRPGLDVVAAMVC